MTRLRRTVLLRLSLSRRWRRSVRFKLTAVMLLTMLFGLLVAGSALVFVDMRMARQFWTQDLSAQANIVALSLAPAMAFDDRAQAARSLLSLRARPAIRAASVYDVRGVLYAQQRGPDEPPLPQTLAALQARPRATGAIIDVVQPISRDGERIGAIYLKARYDVYQRMRAYAGIFALVAGLSAVSALMFATPLQRSVIEPLTGITDAVRQFVHQGDLSARLRRTTHDEFGVVIEGLNLMLDEVQSRTRELQSINDALRASEQRSRTSEAALRDADRRKDEFLATLAHELRNPLAPIRHAAVLLQSPQLPDERRHWAQDVIARQVERMALLLDDLLDVSRITSGRLHLKIEPVELQAIVTSAIETARPLIDAKQHTLLLSLPERPLRLAADPLRLSQALSNLLTNAAKYTDRGGRIRVAAHLDEQWLELSVADNGIGLAPEARPRLFEMFSQVESAIDRAEGGLGIGLALVKGLVGLHGGEVAVSSDGLGQGSTFTVRLPRSLVLDDPTEDLADAVQGATERPLPLRILLADDNHDAAASLGLLMEIEGHRVDVAHSGAEALEIGARIRPQAIILDIGMPGMTGYEAARLIRQQPWGSDPLLIALTGWGQQDDKDRAQAAGFDLHLTKPASVEDIQRVVRTALARSLEARRVKPTLADAKEFVSALQIR